MSYSQTVAPWPAPRPEHIHTTLYSHGLNDDPPTREEQMAYDGNNPGPPCPTPTFRGVEAYPRAGSVSWWKDVALHREPALAEFGWLKRKAYRDGHNSLAVWYINQYDHWADISCLEGQGLMDS